MKINYLRGRASTGKSHYIYERIKEAIEDGQEKNILIVPEQFTLQAEIDLINKMQLEGLLNVQILSFRRLAYRVMTETGGIKKSIITDLGKLMSLASIFEDNKGKLEIFAKSASQDGFLQEIVSLFREFKKNNIDEEDLESYIAKIDDPLLKRKMKDISIIFSDFSKSLAGQYIDEEETLNILAENIKDSDFLQDSLIWFDGFNSFSRQEYKVIDQLFKKAKEISFAFTMDTDNTARDQDLFRPVFSTWQSIEKLAFQNKLTKNIVDFKDKKCSSAEICHLEKNIYSYPSEKYEASNNNIKFFSALNIYSEVERIAAEIIRLAREEDYSWNDLVLVTNALDLYGPVIKKVFYEYDIPVFVDEKKPITNNPLVTFIKASLRIIMDNYRWEDIFIFLKTGFSGLAEEESMYLQNYIIENGIRGKKFTLPFDDERAEAARQVFIPGLEKFREDMKESANLKEEAGAIYNLMVDFALYEKIAEILDGAKEKENFEFVNENTQIWNIIIEILDQLAESSQDKKYALKDFYKLLESGFDNYELGMIPPVIDQVLAGNLERSKSHDIKALFLAGCNDGIIPRAYSEKGILQDSEKLKLSELGMGVYKDNESQLEEEKFLLYSAITKPSEKLYLSWSLGDLEGKALRPSLITERIKKIFDIETETDLFFSKKAFILSSQRPLPAFKFMVEKMREYLDYQKEDPSYLSVYAWYYQNPDWKEKIALMLAGLFHENQEKNLSNEALTNLYKTNEKFSISRLETYEHCPYKHFVRYALRPELKREYKLEMPDIGSIFHDSLEAFPQELAKEGLDWREISLDQAEEIAQESIDKIGREFYKGLLMSSQRNKYLLEKIKRISKRTARTLTRQLQLGDFKAWKFELPFRIVLSEEDKIDIEGRIDRLDIWQNNRLENYIRVIDYKSGSKSFSLADIYNLLQVQLVIYLMATLDISEEELSGQIERAGAFYFKIDDPLIESDYEDLIEESINKELRMDGFLLADLDLAKAMDSSLEEGKASEVIPAKLKNDGNFDAFSQVYSKEDLELIFTYVKKGVLASIDEIKAGKIKIEPIKNKNFIACQHCDYQALCQFNLYFPDNKYRQLANPGKKEILELMKAQVENDD